MLQHSKNKVGIVRVNENIPDMGNLFSLEHLRNRPLASDFLGQLKKAIQGFPRRTPVLTTIQPYGPRPQVNHALIIGVYGECSHIAIHYFLPGSTAILSTIASIEGNTRKNNSRPFLAPGQTFDGAPREKFSQGRHRSVTFLHHGQAVVKGNEKAQLFVHTLFLQNTLPLLMPACGIVI